MDLLYLMWQGMDIIVVIELLGDYIFYVYVKDIVILFGIVIRGVFDLSFGLVLDDLDVCVQIGMEYYCFLWFFDLVWRFVVIGNGYDVMWWINFFCVI